LTITTRQNGSPPTSSGGKRREFEWVTIKPKHVSDIFLSYAREDLPRVKPVVAALEQRGWSVWWDRTIRPGQTFDAVIEAALDEARCIVVLWSRESVKSQWVRTEADEGQQRWHPHPGAPG
jgi:hypothetical protein